MQRSLVVEFTKMNGAGNDFIVIDNRFFQFSVDDLSGIAVRYCPRRFGIGADGLLALDPPGSPDSDFRMRYVNADGSRGTMCGNGARCLVLFARSAGLGEDELHFETDAGPYRARVLESGRAVRLWLPPPYPSLDLTSERVPAEPDHELDVYPIWTGTEHAVCFVPDLEGLDVARVGARIRHHPGFAPAGVNVDFVQLGQTGGPDGVAEIHARTFEKGVEAETPACGTGSVAAAVAAVGRFLRSASRIAVRMPGGVLTVGIDRDDDRITGLYLEGPATAVYRGSFDYVP